MKSRLEKTQSKVTLVATAAIYIYVIARFLAVFRAFTPYHVNPWIFLALDLITALPYAYGWPKLALAVIHKQFAEAMLWGAVVAAAFAIPYIYIGLSAKNLPAELVAAVIIFAVCAASWSTIRFVKYLRSV